jgi:fructokinase
VDLVGEGAGEGREFRAHFGGALANVAVAAARAGGTVALAGGVGADEWGEWLRVRLEAEGVDTRWFSLVPGLETPVAFVRFDEAREPSFAVYGDGLSAGLHSVASQLETAVEAAGSLVFGSNTLVGEPELELTLRARDLAIERGIPVVFDPNLRPNRWEDMTEALGRCREAMHGTSVIRANLTEAQQLTGLDTQAGGSEAATALHEAGAPLAVVTMGAEGAVIRGTVEAEAPTPEVEVVSPLGAGDAFLGVLAAGASRAGWTPEAVAAALPAAVAAGAHACESWGATS